MCLRLIIRIFIIIDGDIRGPVHTYMEKNLGRTKKFFCSLFFTLIDICYRRQAVSPDGEVKFQTICYNV